MPSNTVDFLGQRAPAKMPRNFDFLGQRAPAKMPSNIVDFLGQSTCQNAQ